MMRDFVFGLVKLLQPCTDGLSHNAVQRCGLIRRLFAIGRLRHADTVLVPPVPSTEDAPRSASRQAITTSPCEAKSAPTDGLPDEAASIEVVIQPGADDVVVDPRAHRAGRLRVD